MRIAATLFTLAANLMCFVGALSADVPPSPKLEISAPVFDFGSVSQGTKVTHEFTLKNVGTGTLFIQRIVPACGCTAAAVSGDALNAGQEGKLKVELDTADFSGDKLKLVRIFTNDAENPAAAVTLKGSIEAKVLVEPNRIFFGEIVRAEAGQWEQRLATIRTQPGSGVQIEGIESLSPSVEAKIIEKKADSIQIGVRLSAGVPFGELRERIIVHLRDAKGAYSINVPVYAVVKGTLKLSPATVSFGIIEGKEKIERSVKLDNLGTKMLSIPSIVSSDPALEVQVKEIEPGKKFVLKLNVDPAKVKKDLRATVQVKSQMSGEPDIVLNVFGILAPKAE